MTVKIAAGHLVEILTTAAEAVRQSPEDEFDVPAVALEAIGQLAALHPELQVARYAESIVEEHIAEDKETGKGGQ